jgi:hypothetical protein
MRKNLLTTFLISCSLYTIAQPVLKRENYFKAGQTFEFYLTSLQSPGNSGADQNWDYSGVVTQLAGTYSAVDNVPLPVGFEATNMVLEVKTSVGTKYQFEKVSDSKTEVLKDTEDKSYLHDTKIYVVFPFTYNQEVTDSWMRQDHLTGTALRKYDAYGTVKTPFGTFANAFRIKSSSGGGPDTYTWYVIENGNLIPLVSINNENNTTVIFKNVTVSGNADAQSAVITKVYPNPASDLLNIQTSKTISGLRVADASGLFKSCSYTQNSADISSLSSGLYMLILNFEDGTTSVSQFVKL